MPSAFVRILKPTAPGSAPAGAGGAGPGYARQPPARGAADDRCALAGPRPSRAPPHAAPAVARFPALRRACPHGRCAEARQPPPRHPAFAPPRSRTGRSRPRSRDCAARLPRPAPRRAGCAHRRPTRTRPAAPSRRRAPFPAPQRPWPTVSARPPGRAASAWKRCRAVSKWPTMPACHSGADRSCRGCHRCVRRKIGYGGFSLSFERAGPAPD